jgi:uncharacterized membrane protein
MEERLPNESLIVMLVIILVSWVLAQVVLSVIFANHWFLSLPSFLVQLVFASVLIGFLVYQQRLRDERSIQISDKSTRNGFAFVFFVIPIAIIALSATDISTDVSLALVLVWFGAVVSTGLSALYYYKE